MRLGNNETTLLGAKVYEWALNNPGRSISTAPLDIQDAARKCSEIFRKLKNDELRMMGIRK